MAASHLPAGGSQGAQSGWWLWRLQRKAVPYLFISPFFIVFLIFFLGPAIFAFYAGFHDWSLLTPLKYVGLKNFQLLLRDQAFWKSVVNTLYYIGAALLLQWPLSLLFAVMLNRERLPGRKVFTPAFFIPNLTSSIVIGIVFVLFLDKTYGLFNMPLKALGLEPINWLGSREMSKPAVIILLVWRWVGYNMVLFLSSLKSIPGELYEAAWVDGANRRQAFWSLTLPLLRPAIAYIMIMGIIGGWQIFNEPYILTNGGPSDSSLALANYLYRVSIQNLRMGYGSAIGTVLFIFVFIVSIIQMRFFGVYSEEG